MYESDRRSPLCSVNFITAHDGFTLADLTSYDEKHNEANGEDTKDGESDNRSSHAGVEGPTDDPEVNAIRDRQRRNMLGTLLLSSGVPMVLGGDEIARTQGGNNNAYCQDDEISWFDWANADRDLQDFTRKLIRLRRGNRALRPSWFRGDDVEGAEEAVRFIRADGATLEPEDWTDPNAFSIGVIMKGRTATRSSSRSTRPRVRSSSSSPRAWASRGTWPSPRTPSRTRTRTRRASSCATARSPCCGPRAPRRTARSADAPPGDRGRVVASGVGAGRAYRGGAPFALPGRSDPV